MNIDKDKFRNAVLSELEQTSGWVDDDEVAWLRANPDEPLTSINIDGPFDFGALLERINK
jgi:hypothetical protein